MSRFPSSESSSGPPSMGGLPVSQTSSGSPPPGSFLSISGSPSLGHFRRLEARAEAGSSRCHLISSPSRTKHSTPAGSSQHCSRDGPAKDRSLAMLPPKPPRSVRTPRRLSSRPDKADMNMGGSSKEDTSLSAEKQANSSLKIIIRWRGKEAGEKVIRKRRKDGEVEAPKVEASEEEKEKVDQEEQVEEEKIEEEKIEDQVEKKWNLRRRKPTRKGGGGGGAGKEPQMKEGGSSQKAPKKKPAAAKKPKPLKLSISLTRREIEEDLYAMTGTRPSRKPKRRPKQLQNTVNHLSPAFTLQSFSPSSYNTRG